MELKNVFIISLFLFLGYLQISNGTLSPDFANFDPLFQSWLENMKNEGANPQKPQSTEASPKIIPLANIQNGTVAGSTSATVTGQTIYQYLGVPYAKAPVGPLRFQVKSISTH